MLKDKTGILKHLRGLSDARPRHPGVATGVGVAAFFSMVAAFGIAPNTMLLEQAERQQAVIELLHAQPALPVQTDNDGGIAFLREERIQRGDTVSALLRRLGIDDSYALRFLQESTGAAPIFSQLSPGKNVTAHVGAQGELVGLIFPLNGGKDEALYVSRNDATFSVQSQSLVLNTQIVMKSARIRSSLFGATDAADIPDSVATSLADIFGGSIDFHRDLRKGDSFSVMYETITHLGKLVRTGRVLAAEFVNDGKTHHAVWFETEPGKGGYYTADAKSIRKPFLRSPLEFSRITSGFSSARFHPVLQTWRAHKGIDYGAPTGTKVKSTGDGVVDFVGNKGGYGKVVVLRHQGRYTTLYGHLSSFAGGIKKGGRISQGDIVGYVGATGLASGPHLHYEFRINEIHQNPLSVALPSPPPIAAQYLARFRESAQPNLARIGLIRPPHIALLD